MHTVSGLPFDTLTVAINIQCTVDCLLSVAAASATAIG